MEIREIKKNNSIISETTQHNDPTHPPQLTLRKAILVVIDYLVEIVRKFYVYIILIALCYYGTRLYVGKQISTYSTRITFMLNDAKSGGASGFSQLAGQLGINLGGGGGGEISSDKIIELMSSKSAMYKALCKRVQMDGKTDMLFNHYIRAFNKDEDWKLDPHLKKFKFKNTDFKDFSYAENKAAKNIRKQIIRENLGTGVSQGGIISVNCRSESDEFCLYFITELVEDLRLDYIRTATQQQAETYRKINNRVDSLYTLMISSESRLASWYDGNKKAMRAGTLNGTKLMEQERLKSEAEVYSVMYTEAVKYRETANMNLMASKPVIQVIDYPTFPLDEQSPNSFMTYITSFVLAFIIGTVLIMFNKLVMDALSKEE